MKGTNYSNDQDFLLKVMRFKQNVIKHDRTEEIICPHETAFLQYVGDNTDHNLATLDGKNTHHGLGSIAIANGQFSHRKFGRTAVPRDKKENWSEIQFNQGIPIKTYHPPDKLALKQTILTPIKPEKFSHSFINIVWACSHIFNKQCPSWSGYMSDISTNQPLSRSVVTPHLCLQEVL